MPDSRLVEFCAEAGLSSEQSDALEKVVSGLVRDGQLLQQETVALQTRRIDPVDETPEKLTLSQEEPIGTREAYRQRYDALELIETGGMGEIYRVQDQELGRTMVMKVLKAKFAEISTERFRFIEEAQITAQLQHPNIISVHEVGHMPDGRLYFTMAEVRGRKLSEVIKEVHRASRGGPWRAAPSGWTFRGLVDAFHKVCDAVAYAHSRGVMHRDLKPSNIMVGTFGEVLVMDWGLAKIVGGDGRNGDQDSLASRRRKVITETGSIMGTPAYMAPEQARGDNASLGPAVDVYALGALLYYILGGRPPFRGRSAIEVLEKVLSGVLEPPSRVAREQREPDMESDTTYILDAPLRSDTDVSRQRRHASPDPSLPAELVEACMRAMAARPEERFPDSKQFADAVGDWLEGAKKKERAYEIVARAEQMAPRSEALRCSATEARSQATALLADVNSWDDEASKLSGWELEDQAQSMEREADLVDLEARRLYHAALTYVPQLADAHVALAQAYRADHAAAELDRDRGQAEQAELLLRSHVVALPEARPERAQLVAYLRGVGSLTLRTDPPSAEVDLFRYKQHNRRLVPVFDRSLGSTPLVDVPLAMGSYVLRLRAPECEQVAYPVFVGRQEHWSGVAPGETEPRPVPLPGTGTVSSKECYVPPGWFRCGGDSQLEQTFPQGRVWVDGFIMQRYTVTNAEFIVFLDDLVSRGREQEALAAAPRERGGTVDEPGAVIFGRDPGGGFFLRPDADGDQWEPDCPVMMVTLHGARAYARWWSERTGHHWRIPHEIEWEKAARGVDGRFYPWGDFVDPSWACLRLSHDGRPVPATREQFPQDQSPYGVRHLGGGSRDWCRSRFEVEVGLPPDGLLRIDEFESDCDPMDLFSVRGGWWYAGAIQARSANRQGMEAHARSFHMGIRLVRSWES